MDVKLAAMTSNELRERFFVAGHRNRDERIMGSGMETLDHVALTALEATGAESIRVLVRLRHCPGHQVTLTSGAASVP
jgi:hypothetical protein